MRREDYERMGPGSKISTVPYDITITEGRIVHVCCASLEDTPTGPQAVSLIVEVRGEEGQVGIILSDKDVCDNVIRSLISARNHLWPTP